MIGKMTSRQNAPLRDPGFFAFLCAGLLFLGCGWLCGRRAQVLEPGLTTVAVQPELVTPTDSPRLYPVALELR